ncbi:MAG: homocysteine S-methyltransferase family protein, partial [Clostridia bacterium]|nr:homocysteine S-methyltransferase family protein [Clostridia bacterium]
MNIRQKIKEGFVFFDGATGTMLSQMASLIPGQAPETLNLQEPQAVTALHRMYIEAGANVLKTNTFGANRLKHKDPDAIIAAAFACAKEAKGEKDVCIALDIGPLGKLLKPLGTLDFEEAVSVFADMVRSGVKYGADAILIETMIDTYELKAALLAAKEHSDLPVFVSCTVGADGKLMTGADPEAVVALVEGLGADAVGVNCSAGPESLRETVKRFYEAASIPVIANPYANLPRIEDGKPVYDTTDKEFAESACLLAKNGARMLGGCCGTTPAMIAALKAALQNETPLPLVQRKRTVISSHTHAYLFESNKTNSIYLDGYICKEPIYRKTPLG